jgi:putative MFS transporter
MSASVQTSPAPALLDDSVRIRRVFASLDQSAFSPRHLLLYTTVILLHFFDGYDLLMTGVILPGVSATFTLTAGGAGLLASGVFVGMLVGALGMTMLADRIGRKAALFLSVAWYAVLSVAAAAAPNYQVLVLERVLQGVGLGAEVPLVFTYVAEFVPVHRRGLLSASSVFFWQGAGLVAALSAILIIPAYTWRGMFLVGGIPAFVILLAWFFFPESPRYLIRRGRLEEAEAVARRYSSVPLAAASIDRDGATRPDAPGVKARLRDLIAGRYARITIGAWMMNFLGGVIFNALATWLPSIFMRMGFTLVHSCAFTAVIAGSGAVGNLAHAAVMDRIGRRLTLTLSFFIAAVSCFAWGYATTPLAIMVLGAITAFTGAGGIIGPLFTYITELYPTRYRATAVGWSTGWQRIGGIVAPVILGAALGNSVSLFASFAVMSGLLAIAGVIAITMTYETKGKPLEQITAELSSISG